MMACYARCSVLPILCTLMIVGCSGHNFKDSAGERLSLSNYDRVALQPVVAGSHVTHESLPDDLAVQIRSRLSESTSWTETTDCLATPEASKDGNSLRQVDLAVTIVKAHYPSRSKIVWLGSAHKMTCYLEVHDHLTNDVLGSTTVSSSVEPPMGNAALLNFGTIGIIGRACFDTREHDTRSLLAHMAKEIVKVLDHAKESPPHKHSKH